MRWPILILLVLWVATPHLALAQSCECEAYSCNSCEYQSNLEFYTAKCDGNRVKSCSKPVCSPIDPLPKHCQAQQAKTEEKAASESKTTEKTIVKSPVGTVLLSMGSVEFTRDGVAAPLRVNNKVFNGDEVIVGENGKTKIILSDDSTMTLLPKTKTTIHHERIEKQSSTMINLMYGSVRSIITKSDTTQKRYKVETPSAVAGVRGTDFVTTFYPGSKITKVETLSGAVELTSRTGASKTLIPAGHYASFVVDTGADKVSGSMKYVDDGFITPLGTLNPEQIKGIHTKTDFEETRAVATYSESNEPVCSAPVGRFNQCSFECRNNPKGINQCRTDLKNVQCVRKRCNANGQWAEETRLPASEYEKCQPTGIVVDKCDY